MIFFVGHDSWRYSMPDNRTHFEKMSMYYGEVKILRPLMFFHEGQENVKISDLTKFFTEQAIFTFIHDKFIEIEELDKEDNVIKND
jgi:hypothetical protein